MKAFQQAIDEIVFQSGGTGNLELQTIAKSILQSVLDSHTAYMRYPELLIVEQELNISNLATGLYALPTNWQHIDWNTLHIRLLGDSAHQYFLSPIADDVYGVNFGPVKYYSFNGTTLKVWPYSDLVAEDELILNYYRKCDLETDGFIIPDSLADTVIMKSVSRLALTLGSKSAGDYMTLGQEARTAHLGQVYLPSANE